MTSPRESRAKALNALAALIHEIRPEWHPPGIVAGLRGTHEHLALAQLAIAAIRYADDLANTTPAHIADLGNRAWDSDWWTPCKIHPDTRTRTPAGECGNCRSDRIGTDGEPQPLRRRGVPPAPQVRDELLAAMRPARAAGRERPQHQSEQPGEAGCG